MSCALNSAEAKVQQAITMLLSTEDPKEDIPKALRLLRSTILDLNALRAQAPQRRILDQQITLGEVGVEAAWPGAAR
jgi:hypothetical protein